MLEQAALLFGGFLAASGLLSGAALAASCAGTSFGAGFTSYTCDSLGSVPGLPTPYGGVTFLNNNTLLIGGAANTDDGAIYEIGITRGADNHITGFSGPASVYATAPFIDGGLTFGPGGVLFFTGYPTNTLGEIKPASSAPDATVALDESLDSVGSIVLYRADSPEQAKLKSSATSMAIGPTRHRTDRAPTA